MHHRPRWLLPLVVFSAVVLAAVVLTHARTTTDGRARPGAGNAVLAGLVPAAAVLALVLLGLDYAPTRPPGDGLDRLTAWKLRRPPVRRPRLGWDARTATVRLAVPGPALDEPADPLERLVRRKRGAAIDRESGEDGR